jgi:hypothetical protein
MRKAAIELYPVVGKKVTAAASEAGLSASSIPTLLLGGDDRHGLGLAIAQALTDAGINMTFFVAQAVGRRFSAVLGFESESGGEQEEVKGYERRLVAHQQETDQELLGRGGPLRAVRGRNGLAQLQAVQKFVAPCSRSALSGRPQEVLACPQAQGTGRTLLGIERRPADPSRRGRASGLRIHCADAKTRSCSKGSKKRAFRGYSKTSATGYNVAKLAKGWACSSAGRAPALQAGALVPTIPSFIVAFYCFQQFRGMCFSLEVSPESSIT